MNNNEIEYIKSAINNALINLFMEYSEWDQVREACAYAEGYCHAIDEKADRSTSLDTLGKLIKEIGSENPIAGLSVVEKCVFNAIDEVLQKHLKSGISDEARALLRGESEDGK